jgi:hypothetical protein
MGERVARQRTVGETRDERVGEDPREDPLHCAPHPMPEPLHCALLPFLTSARSGTSRPPGTTPGLPPGARTRAVNAARAARRPRTRRGSGALKEEMRSAPRTLRDAGTASGPGHRERIGDAFRYLDSSSATSRNTDGAAYGSSNVTVQRSGVRS